MAKGRALDDESVALSPRRRVGRPKQNVLTRELIAQAALELLDTVGEQQFTVGLLARRLKVSPSALYNHFRNKEAVMAAVRELISDRISVEPFQRLPWDEALREWAWSYREAFAAHPITIAVFATTSVTDSARTLMMYEGVVGPLVAAGWPRDRVISMMVSLESFILGSALDAAAPADMFDPGEHAGEVPQFSGALVARDQRLGGQSAADESFEMGLDAMLLGLRALYAEMTC
ncbi:MAG: TetR/AcrR family transcriptional regulator [Microbacteriaceae bacterium]